MRFVFSLSVCISIFPSVAFGLDTCPSTFSSAQSIIQCAETRSPEIQQALLSLESAKAEVRSAGQWTNPTLSADSYSGKVSAVKSSETEIALGVPLELGGKISARRSVAEGGATQAEAALFQARSQVRASTVLALHRLRQLIHEQEVVDESISTFKRLISQYSRRPKLSPENELSSSVFGMAQSDYELKRSQIQDEFGALDEYFKLSIGAGLESIKQALPSSPKAWPKIEGQSIKGSSPRAKLLAAELKTAKARLSVAQSESWPTVTVGPSVKIVGNGDRSDQLYGFNISLPLPLFNTNGAARSAARANVNLSETRTNLGFTEEEKLREKLLSSYNQSVAVLASTLSHQNIEKKHKDIERLFLRGIVPSALVIEAHRTFVELEKSRNEREIKALEALLSVYALDGKQMETIL